MEENRIRMTQTSQVHVEEIYERVQRMVDEQDPSSESMYSEAALKLLVELVQEYGAGVIPAVLSAPCASADRALHDTLANAGFVALAKLRLLPEVARLMGLLKVSAFNRVLLYSTMAAESQQEDRPTIVQAMRTFSPKVEEPIARLNALVMTSLTSGLLEDRLRILEGDELRSLLERLDAGEKEYSLFQALFNFAYLVDDPDVVAIGITCLEEVANPIREQSERILWFAINGWDAKLLDALSAQILGSRYHDAVLRLAEAARRKPFPN